MPQTLLVAGVREVFKYRQLATGNHCGEMIFANIGDPTAVYLPWRFLNLAADTLTRHFGHTREPVKWELTNFWYETSAYLPWEDKIVLWQNFYDPGALWVVAHEYGHALHHKALGGLWQAPNCNPHHFAIPSSYECALAEGFANYAGTVGSGGHYEQCFEHLGTPSAPEEPDWCRGIRHDQKPEIEGWVAALLMDLIDDTEEKGDKTEYPGHYIAEVFKSCKVKAVKAKDWKKRTKVSDIVWCLERLVTPVVHEKAFPGIDAPDTVREEAEEPLNWHWSDIRLTWLKNLTDGLAMEPPQE